MKKISLAIIFSLSSTPIFPCTTCNRSLQNAIYDSTFLPNLGTLLSAFFVLGIIVIILTKWSVSRYQTFVSNNHPISGHLNPVPLATAAIIIGIGIGGFIDGIVLHQILQWHEMLSNKVSVDTVLGKSVNMFWDGIFHFFSLIVVFTGIILLWKLSKRRDVNLSKHLLIGGLLLGWGLFNIVEGIIDHHILQIHYVRQVSPDPELWNILFIVVSIIMVGAGALLIYKRPAERIFKVTHRQ